MSSFTRKSRGCDAAAVRGWADFGGETVENSPMTFRTTSIAVGLICISAVAAAAQEPVHVLASNGMKAVIQELQPRCERAIGHPLAIEYNSTTGLMEKIDGGVAFDVAILTSEGVEELVKKGKVAAGTRADFARSGIGVAVRSGAAKPDIATPAASETDTADPPVRSHTPGTGRAGRTSTRCWHGWAWWRKRKQRSCSRRVRGRLWRAWRRAGRRSS